MNGKNKVYFVNHTSNWGPELPRKLTLFGYATKILPTNEDMLQTIRDDCPDVIVVDAFLPQPDVTTIIRECSALPNPPKFIIRSIYRNINLQQQLEENGSYYVLLPVDADVLSQKIEELCNPSRQGLRMQISNILRTIGVPASILGYHYLRDSIMMAIENDNTMLAVTKQIYPDVARKYNATSAQVERTIRHAIKTAWEHDVERLNQYFGRTSLARPTNSEFIAMVADKIRLGMR